MRRAFALMSILAMAFVGVMATPDESSAVPAFARQTGNDCNACHFQYFPKLNSYGRAFKLGGFTEASVDLIEGDNISMPAVMPLSFITKLRYVQETHKESGDPKSGAERGEWQIPDEATFFAGGRISENVGWAGELADNMWGKVAVIIKGNVGDANVGLTIQATDGHGPFNGTEVLNTALQRGQRGFESRGEYAINHKMGLVGNATAVQLYYGSGMVYAMAGLWGPADTISGTTIDTGFELNTVARLVVMPTVGDWETAVGVGYLGGTTKCVECVGDGAEHEIKADAFIVDAQAQGELGNGMTLELQAMYATGGGDDISVPSAKGSGWNVAAMLGLTPKAGVKAAYRSYEPDKGDGETATVIGVWYMLAQNVQPSIEYTIYGGDGRSKDSKMYVMLFAGF